MHAVDTAKSRMHCFWVNSTELASLDLPNITCAGYTRSTMSIRVNPHLKHSPHAIQDMHDFLLLNMYKYFKNNQCSPNKKKHYGNTFYEAHIYNAL